MITAIVLITADVDRIPEVAQEIADLEGVTEVYSVAGDADLIAMVRVREHEELADVIADRVNKVTGVTGTNTHIAFRTYSSHDLEAAFSLGLEADRLETDRARAPGVGQPASSLGHRDPALEQRPRRARVDRRIGPVHAGPYGLEECRREGGPSPRPDAVARAMPALSTTASRTGPRVAAEEVARDLGVVRRVATAQRLDRAAVEPEVGRVEREPVTVPSRTHQTVDVVARVSSSRPSSPRKTAAGRPRPAKTPAMSGAMRASATPTAA